MPVVFDKVHLRTTVLGGIITLAGCTEPLDFDLRGNLGGFSTAPAAQSVTITDRPVPDAQGVISYPSYQVAIARRGDTVVNVANRVGLNPDELARFNGIASDVPLRKGEVLVLPRRAADAAEPVDIAAVAGAAIDAAPDTTPARVETTLLEPADPEPIRHKVARGETAYTIARLYQVPVKSLAEWNGLDANFVVREGQYLLIPIAGQTPKNSAETDGTTAPGEGTPTPKPPSSNQPLPEKVAAAVAEPEVADVGRPSVSATRAQMEFPVKGKIIRDYSKGRNDGIDIAASPGAPVIAAIDGTVAAITSDTGKVPIIVLRHPDNILTVYANVDDIRVQKGDSVKRGTRIASLRDGDDAYVHFEVRNGFDSVNPMSYLE
ncbi:MAG: peptidoglycan DD-metalloendopeptidase family protein [Rhodobacteraceae bacterium]|nr:peptidoglycan DD-metalloendopeptidase family protein [Paracoccaceae bacterium]